jgi:hypothetical protein
VERAAAIVRWITESEKAESERSNAFKGEGLEKMRSSLTEAVQFDADVERLVLERQLALMRDMLGEKDDIIRSQFGSQSAERLAAGMLESTILGDGAALETLLQGGSAAVKRSQDPFLRLALAMQPRYDDASARQRELAQALETQRERMGRALYDVYGTAYPPDATFSLRISDGVVQGYAYNGTIAPAFTTFYGMYDRYHSFKDSDTAFDAMMSGNAWDLPPRWKNPPPSFDLATPFNFVSTADIIGGNSGSPVINIRKEIVGLAFDGNIESLPGEFIFAEDKGNRTISVHSAGIFESLKHIYRMDRIIEELENARK